MKRTQKEALNLLYSNMPEGNTFWLSNKTPVKAEKIFVIGSDIEAAYNAMLVYHSINKSFGYAPKIYCCGGEHKFFPETQAMFLKKVCLQLGAAEDRIVLDEEGDDIFSTLNYLWYREELKNEVVVFATAFRNHLLVRYWVERLSLKVDAYYCALFSTVAYDLRQDNCFRLWNNTLLAHEIVALYKDYGFNDRGVSDGLQCRKIVAKLKKQMACSQNKDYFRYLMFQLSFYLKKWWIKRAIKKQIKIYQSRLWELNLGC